MMLHRVRVDMAALEAAASQLFGELNEGMFVHPTSITKRVLTNLLAAGDRLRVLRKHQADLQHTLTVMQQPLMPTPSSDQTSDFLQRQYELWSLLGQMSKAPTDWLARPFDQVGV